MIELLLAADQVLAAGDLDRAERIYRQVVDADPRNAIAVVGLARVAEARGLMEEAHEFVARALALDPEDVAALRLVAELQRPVPASPAPRSAASPEAAPETTLEEPTLVPAPPETTLEEPTPEAAAAEEPTRVPSPPETTLEEPTPEAAAPDAPTLVPAPPNRGPSVIERLRRFLGMDRSAP